MAQIIIVNMPVVDGYSESECQEAKALAIIGLEIVTDFDQNEVKKVADQLLSVSPQPKMGRWIPISGDGYADGYPVYDYWECSECGWEHEGEDDTLTAYCPNCGAEMKVGEEL